MSEENVIYCPIELLTAKISDAAINIRNEDMRLITA